VPGIEKPAVGLVLVLLRLLKSASGLDTLLVASRFCGEPRYLQTIAFREKGPSVVFKG
jgi:hypothetical protein